MHKKLIIDCFEKAKSETGAEKTSVLSKHISDALSEEYNYPVNERTLRNYINDLEKENFSISINIANELAKYLGYKDLKDYSKNVANKKKKKSFNKYIIGGLIVVASYFGIEANMDKCMIWNEDHFEKIACEEKNAKPINKELLNRFKKINPNCDYAFFNEKGEVQVWYGKSFNKELEYFTQLEVHPETGKTLKLITNHMINKYICLDKN